VLRRRRGRHPLPTVDEIPTDNRELAGVVVEFARLRDDSQRSCPVRIADLLTYLRDEVPGGQRLQPADLTFLRTAQVGDSRYWIWCLNEPDGGDPAYATVSVEDSGRVTSGYDTNTYGLTPEQFMLGDYHKVF
jgi:hypothetical protein